MKRSRPKRVGFSPILVHRWEKACSNILHTSTNPQVLVLNVYRHPCHKYLWRGDVIMVIISFCIDLFYFQSLQQGLRGKSREKIIALLSENGKLTAAGLAAEIGVTAKAIEKHLAKLKAEGIIEREGPDKGGSWKVK